MFSLSLYYSCKRYNRHFSDLAIIIIVRSLKYPHFQKFVKIDVHLCNWLQYIFCNRSKLDLVTLYCLIGVWKICIDHGGEKYSGVFLQLVTFCSAFCSVIMPILGRPFLSNRIRTPHHSRWVISFFTVKYFYGLQSMYAQKCSSTGAQGKS